MLVTVTGATGLIGSRLVRRLKADRHEVTVLSRAPGRARANLGVDAEAWNPESEPAPVRGLAGRDSVVHLAGENVAQRWTAAARRRIRLSRELGTRNLVAGIEAADPRPGTLVSSSAVGYYGAHGDEELDEDAPAGDDFLAEVCVIWEQEAQRAEELGLRVARMRTGVVLERSGGALAKMLPFFRLGIGGPVAGGRQWVPWIHVDDVVGLYAAAVAGDQWTGPFNAVAPEPATNAELSKALGRALHRPAVLPVPGFAVAALYGRMASIVTEGQRAVPRRALGLGHRFAKPELDEALRSALED